MRALQLRTLAVVVGLALAPWTWVVANTAYMLAIRDGGDDSDGASGLALMAAHPTLGHVSVLAVMVGGILVVPAVLGFYRIAGDRAGVVVGGGLMVAGYICYAGIGASSALQQTMADYGGPVDDFAAVIDASYADPWTLWTFLLFVLGNLVGTLLLAGGLWRSRTTPRWVPVAIAAWPVLHVVGLVALPNEVPQVVGAVLQALGFGRCALVLARGGPRTDRAEHVIPPGRTPAGAR